jgi:hypothetical protein
MTILSTIEGWGNAVLSVFAPKTAAQTKTLDEFLQFLAGFPYTQVAAAALAEGTNIPLDATAAAAILADITKSFYSGQSVQTATMSLTAQVGISPAIASQIVFDPVHPADPTQFSRGR